MGLEPISKEDFAKALEESEKAIKNGDVISADKAYAEFKERYKVRGAKISNKALQPR